MPSGRVGTEEIIDIVIRKMRMVLNWEVIMILKDNNDKQL